MMLEDTGAFEPPFCSRGIVCDSDVNLGIVSNPHFRVSGIVCLIDQVAEQFRYFSLLLCVQQFCIALWAILSTFLEHGLAWFHLQACLFRAGNTFDLLWKFFPSRMSWCELIPSEPIPEGCCQTHVLDRWCVGSFLDGRRLSLNLGSSLSIRFNCRFARSFVLLMVWLYNLGLCDAQSFCNHYPFTVCVHPAKIVCVNLLQPFCDSDSLLRPLGDFDCTLGFEGEGPWTLATLNVGSLEKHVHVVSQDIDVLALQETRHTQSNIRNLSFQIGEKQKEVIWGPAMKFHASGQPDWGGVAIVSEIGSSRGLESKEDASGHFPSCLSSSRVTFAWTSINASHSMLVACVYGFSGAQSDSAKHIATDNLLKMILEVVAQYGNIPIAICGDFQAVPHSFPCIREAIAKGVFFDPILSHGSEGFDRPTTFCKSSNWKSDQPMSSLDGILLNHVAFASLQSTEVQRVCGLQHALVKLTFDFQVENPKGFKWRAHAKLCLSKLAPMPFRESIDEKYQHLCVQNIDADELARLANDFSLEILLKSGATWKQGSKERGTIPNFEYGNRDFLQGFSQDAPSKALNLLDKTLRRIDDLLRQIGGENPTEHSMQIASTCWRRIRKVLLSLEAKVDHEIPPPEDLFELWNFVSQERHRLALRIRAGRIKNWKAKMQNSAATTNKDVFTYLKMKHNLPVYTPICDKQGIPIRQPTEALTFVVEQWNDVFSANPQPFNSEPFFRVVGPLLGNNPHSCNFQPITPEELQAAAGQRKTTAAAGIDGWRTDEIQALPTDAFLPWALLWNAVEQGILPMPKIFRVARLVMLPKPDAKNHEPISRRLISLLSVQYLAYSRARFQASIPWQLKTFPKNLCGAVQGRQASDVSHSLAISNEIAIANCQGRVGIKLDRSKCFDRVIPNLIKELGERLGLDKGFLRAWTAVYVDFKRFITYGSFISKDSLQSNNGIAQGDCASVLAINILMCAWTKLMACCTKVRSFIYIDDAYVDAALQDLNELIAAVRATELFDEVSGQALNLTKSCAWGTTQKARKLLTQHFPQMPICELVQVLGGHIKANARPNVIHATSKFHLIKSLIDSIGHLPISFRSKAKIIAIKVSPMIAFASEINPWARKQIESFTSSIVKALWQDRPHWRSQELLFALAFDPTKIYPPAVLAITAICNVAKRCRADIGFFNKWLELVRAPKVIRKGLLDNFGSACCTVGLRFVPPFGLQFLDFPIQSLLDFSPKALRKLIRVATRQALYSAALSSSRHDLRPFGSGVVDPDLNPLGRDWDKPWHSKLGRYDETIYLGPLLGASPTGNRLYKANLLDHPKCRFCEHNHEDIIHLTSNCPGVQQILGKVVSPLDQQFQWDSHGIFEVPQWLVATMQNSTGPTIPDFRRIDVTEVWTDGSVVNPNFIFAKSLGAAVIDVNGTGWCDAWGCSFKAELVALHCAVVGIVGALHVCTDCKSLKNVFDEIRKLGFIPDNFAYRDLWTKIFDGCGFRNQCRVKVRWVKAHQIDSLNWSGGSIDQQLNRVADLEAKRQAVAKAPTPLHFYESVKWHLQLKRSWLSRLSLLLSSSKSDASHDEKAWGRDDDVPESSQAKPINELYPKWDWNLPREIYKWSMIQVDVPPPKYWTFTKELWNVTLQFFKDLQWRCDENVGLSIYELSFHFYRRFRICPPEINNGTANSFLVLPGWLRHCLRTFKKCGIKVAPDGIDFEPRKALFAGAYFPYGRWFGARVFVESQDLRSLANFILSLPDGGKSAASWNRGLSSIP